jgi:glutathione S-transferase
MIDELALFTRSMTGDFLVGPLSAADFTLYPFIAFLWRIESKKLPDLGADSMLTPELRAWKVRMEALPFFERTVPPHWKNG